MDGGKNSEPPQESVLALCTNTPKQLLRCPECNAHAFKGRPYSSAPEDAWAILLYCHCTTQWVVCCLCSSTREHMRKPGTIRFHGWNKHRKTTSPLRKKIRSESPLEENDDDDEDDEKLSADCETTREDELLPVSEGGDILNPPVWCPIGDEQQTRSDVADCRSTCLINDNAVASDGTKSALSTSFGADFFGTTHSKEYFQSEHKARRGGLRDIVAKSQFGFTSMAQDISVSDVVYTKEVAHFAHNLSRGQREHFAKILSLTAQKAISDAKRKGKWKCSIPTTYLDIRRQYTGYPESFLNIMPAPTVNTLGSFACVRLKDCVQNFLAYGYALPQIPTDSTDSTDADSVQRRVATIVESKYCRTRLKELESLYNNRTVLVLWILEWSDGYDPHGFSKSNRGSAWIKVVTFVPPVKYSNSVMYTYPVALGPATADHDVVEKQFRDDLLELSDHTRQTNRFYSGYHKKFVEVHVELVTSLMDQPERRSNLHLTRGNSICGRRWGYTVHLENCKDVLVPCTACSSRLFQGDRTWDSTPCPMCAQWDMDRPDNAMKLRWKCPIDYPASEAPSDGYLMPAKLTFPMLKRAVKKASTLLSEGAWSKNNVEAYLSSVCINKKMIQEVVTRAENIRVLNEAELHQRERPDVFQEIIEIFGENESQFAEVECPPLWDRGVSLHQHIDVIMHLIFLGAVDGTLMFVNQWLKAHNKYASFMRAAEKRLAGVKKLNLNWCKSLLFKGEKLGGWVSENYLAFTRLCKWFFLILDGLEDEPEYVEPDKPQPKWTAVQNRGWLKVRGLDTSGNALELRERVAGYMSQSEGPPAKLQPAGTIQDVFDLVQSMFGMVQSLMVSSCTEDEIQKADMAVKTFLTRFAQLDNKVNRDKKTVQWISSYTFPCLLNLPATMREFGPLRNYWEGGVRGEGFLPFVKPVHGTIGLRTGWPKTVMDRIIKKKTLGNISGGTALEDWELDEVGETDTADTDADELSYHKREFFKYPNEAAAYRDFVDRLPLSVIITECGKLGMVTRSDIVLLLRRVDPSTDVILRKLTFIHWSTEFVGDDGHSKVLSNISLDSIKVSHASLLLPHPNLPNRYYAIRSDWKEMNSSTEFN